MERHLAPIAVIEKDRLGSCIARLKGRAERPRVMLAAHMDEVGFMVSHFSGSFVRFNPLGGWWYPRMIGLPVKIRTAKGEVHGVIATKNPYEMEEEERKGPFKAKDLYIDVGLFGKKSPESLGIRPGDPVAPCLPFTILEGGRAYMAKAWDDRAGCVMLIEVLAALARTKLPNAVYGVGTVQEEVGIRGAMTSGFRTNPDVCLVLEVDIAQDTPGSSEGSPGKLGGGVSICVYDATLIPNAKLRDHVVAVAKRKKIPFQYSAVAFGGTDGGRVHTHRGGRADARDQRGDPPHPQRRRDHLPEGFRQRGEARHRGRENPGREDRRGPRLTDRPGERTHGWLSRSTIRSARGRKSSSR